MPCIILGWSMDIILCVVVDVLGHMVVWVEHHYLQIFCSVFFIHSNIFNLISCKLLNPPFGFGFDNCIEYLQIIPPVWSPCIDFEMYLQWVFYSSMIFLHSLFSSLTLGSLWEGLRGFLSFTVPISFVFYMVWDLWEGIQTIWTLLDILRCCRWSCSQLERSIFRFWR